MKTENRKIRYFVCKKQKYGNYLYYWQPTVKLRQNGFLPRRLSNDFEIAQVEAENLNLELDAWRNGGSEPKDTALHKGSLLSDVIESYKKDPVFTQKALATQRIYTQCMDRIDTWGGDQPIASIRRSNIIDFHRTLYAKIPSFANAIGRQMRIVFEFAHDLGLIDTNPARRIKMPTRPPRQQIWSEEEQLRFIETATERGHPSIVLAVLLGACTGQRQGDILKSQWDQYDGNELQLRQSKTKRWVSVPVLPELKIFLDTCSRKTDFIVTSEATGKPYKTDHFRHLYRDIAKSAGLEHLQFRDLRRTAIVRLAEAGVSTAGITAISGHDIAHCESILETYMPRNTEMARQAIYTYQNYRKRKAKEQSKIKSWKKSRK